TLYLAVERVAVVTGLRAQGDTTVCPLGSADGTLSCMASALLSPGLAATAANLCAGQSGLSALTLVGQVVNDCSVHNCCIRLDAEHGVRKVHFPNALAGHIINCYLWH